MMLIHKNDSQMYNLIYFFVGNGLDVRTAANWIQVADIVNGSFAFSAAYSKKEKLDIQRVVEKGLRGELLTGKKVVFDMILGRPTEM